MTPAKLTQEAERLLQRRVPFRHQGRTELGMDCAGFLIWLVRYAGRVPKGFHDTTGYRPGPQEALLQTLKDYLTPIPSAREGAILAIRWSPTTPVAHVAYCAGSDMIHCYRTAGGIVRHRYGEPWIRMTDSFWAIPGVDHE